MRVQYRRVREKKYTDVMDAAFCDAASFHNLLNPKKTKTK